MRALNSARLLLGDPPGSLSNRDPGEVGSRTDPNPIVLCVPRAVCVHSATKTPRSESASAPQAATQSRSTAGSAWLTAGVGFEPTGDLSAASGFQDRPVRPLRHPAAPTLSRRRALSASARDGNAS